MDGGVAKRAPSQMSCLGSVDVHAGDEVDAGAQEVFQHDVAHADGGVDDQAADEVHGLGMECQRDGFGRAHGQQRLVAAGYGHGGGKHAHGAGGLLMRELIATRAVVSCHGAHLCHGAVRVTLYLYGQEALGWAGGAVELQRFDRVYAYGLTPPQRGRQTGQSR